MIAAPRTTVPIPEAVAALSARQLPDRARAARRQAWEASARLTLCRQPRYEEGRQLALGRIASASKVLAAHNPNLVPGWGDLPGLNR